MQEIELVSNVYIHRLGPEAQTSCRSCQYLNSRWIGHHRRKLFGITSSHKEPEGGKAMLSSRLANLDLPRVLDKEIKGLLKS